MTLHTAAAVAIRDIESFSEIRQVQALQQAVWGFSELDVVPLTILVATREFGGMLIGALDGETLAVLSAYRDLGCGLSLMLA